MLDTKFTLSTHGVLSDSAFPVSGRLFNKIITPLKDNELDALPPHLHFDAVRMHNAIISIRQAAEWGMGAVLKPYKRLELPLPYNPFERAKRLEGIHRLYNLRVERTGISQIKTVFFGSTLDI